MFYNLLVILYSIIELDEPIPNIENAHTRIVYFIDVFNSFTLIKVDKVITRVISKKKLMFFLQNFF